MNNKIIALAVAAAVMTPLASQADVDIYGKARMGVAVSDNGAKDGSATSVDSTASRIGFKGKHWLKDDLTLIWQIENTVDFDNQNGGDVWGGARNTFLGLQGDMGTVLAGRHDTPYKKASGGPADPFVDTWGDYNGMVGRNIVYTEIKPTDDNNNGIIDAAEITAATKATDEEELKTAIKRGTIKHDDRLSNLIAYKSPKINGFQAFIGYSPDEKRDAADTDSLSLSGTYQNGPLYLAAAHQTLNEQGIGGDDADATKLVGGYTFGATTAHLVWETLDQGGKNNDRDNVYLSLKHKAGDTTFKLAYGNVGELDSVKDSGAMFLVVGFAQAITKDAEWYALYGTVNNDKNGLYGFEKLPAGKVGGDVDVFSVGVNYKFSYNIAKSSRSAPKHSD
ncbi:MAG: porin [Gammaproteobacteria bacterium]|nr:porin [Gammaproteobacteria bacterium]